MTRGIIFIGIGLLAVELAGCGYTLQTSRSVLVEKEGVHRVFVEPVVNNTYKPGVENMVYNAIVKEIAASGAMRIVQNRNNADAVLKTVVASATYSEFNGASQSVNNLAGSGALNPNENLNLPLPSAYDAVLACSFTLARKLPVPPGKKAVIWTGSFQKDEPFPASTELSVYGATTPLINDSQFERALGDLAKVIAQNAREDMLEGF